MTDRRRNWVRWISSLLLGVSFLILPATTIAAPLQFDPSSHLPMLRNNYCTGTRSSSIPLGTQQYGPTGNKTTHFNLLQNTQSPWLRDSIYWFSVEPTDTVPSNFIWGSVDANLRAAKQNCLNMIATVEGIPAWAATNGDRSPIKTEALDDFAEFMAALVERYDGDGNGDAPSGIVVHNFEIMNEPDFGSEVPGQEGYGLYGAKYAQMLQKIYQPMHDASPDVKVVFGGIAYNLFVNEGNGGLFVRNFLKSVLDAGGGAYFDVMNFHYYPFQHNRTVWTQGDGSGLPEKYNDIKQQLKDHGLENKPIYVTEVGWHSEQRGENHNYPSTPGFQARRVTELMTQAMSLGSQVTIWWTFFDESEAFQYATGLTTSGNTPETKPSYFAYQQVLRRLGNSEFVAVTKAPSEQNDLEAYEFHDKSTNKTFYVAWLNPTVWVNEDAVNSFNDDATQNLQVPGNKATVISIATAQGEQTQVINDSADGNSDNKVTIPVGHSPVYIVIN